LKSLWQDLAVFFGATIRRCDDSSKKKYQAVRNWPSATGRPQAPLLEEKLCLNLKKDYFFLISDTK